ncbi:MULTISPECIES: hypothetical protein [unclassified Brevundimonas]|uniref:hypothetical protein n=1 Tax=unclassified Brevundimonas TaxID=2622653 RepID=UPI003F8DABFC
MRKFRTRRRGCAPVRALSAFDVGAELMFADRKLESGLDGDMSPLILFAEYGF